MTVPGTWKRWRQRLEYAVLRAAFAITSRLPHDLRMRAGAATGEFAYRVLRVRRRVVEDNLRSTLGQFTGARELARIARATYRNLGQTLLEYGSFRSTPRGDLLGLVEVEGREHLEQTRRVGRGLILLTGHFGSWELLGAVAAAQLGCPTTFLARRQSNPWVDRYMNATRAHLGVGLLHPGAELRAVFRALKRHEALGMLADQDAGEGGLFIDVLGRVASVQVGAAVFAVRTGAPIMCGYLVRQPSGRQLAIYEAPLIPDPGTEPDLEIERLVRAYAASLERFIMRYPEQYYWVHRRWKTRPPAAQGGEDRGD